MALDDLASMPSDPFCCSWAGPRSRPFFHGRSDEAMRYAETAYGHFPIDIANFFHMRSRDAYSRYTSRTDSLHNDFHLLQCIHMPAHTPDTRGGSRNLVRSSECDLQNQAWKIVSSIGFSCLPLISMFSTTAPDDLQDPGLHVVAAIQLADSPERRRVP